MASTSTGSKRWVAFNSALELAIQRATHKWTYEDFTECFSLWCEEEPASSQTVFNTVAQHMESGITEKVKALLAQFEVKDNLDKLHEVVTDARARKEEGNYDAQDVWRDDLQPKAAVRARTMPLLEAERDRLKEQLEELNGTNLRLQAEMLSNEKAREDADAEAMKLLDFLEEVNASWSNVPMDEIEEWTLRTVESMPSATSPS